MNKEFLEDLIRAQKEIKPIPKKGKNPHFKSEYAEYDDVVEACKLACSKYNIFITHRIITHADTAQVELLTELHHTSGDKLDSCMPLLNKAQTDQGMGSSISYAKRYTLVSLLAVATGDDDDGQKATQSPPMREPGFEPDEEFPNFDTLPAKKPGPFKVPESVAKKISSGDTEHKDGQPEHKWNANKKYPGSFYCSKKLVDGNFCKEQRHEP